MVLYLLSLAALSLVCFSLRSLCFLPSGQAELFHTAWECGGVEQCGLGVTGQSLLT